ncbi:MAG: hypothetical protein DRP57_08125 [Spirochaetes bacterium]|nr:MAG: hypothetical protein DRP57_08125 [Spirochaetota bacterium]
MNKKFFLFLALFSILLVFSLYAQDLKPLGNDLSAVLDGFGKEILPNIAQSSLSGTGIGEAEIGDFPHMFFALSGGAVLSHGIGTFIDKDNTNFELLNVYGLINTALENADQNVQNLYTTSKTFFPYPNYRLSIGFGTVYGIESIVTFAILPQGLVDFGTGLANITGITLNSFNGGIRLRKVLLSDTGGFPAVSFGAGYSYSSFNAGYSLKNFSQPMSSFTLNLEGSLNMAAAVHSAGFDLGISKKFFVFIPFLKTSAWYQWADYKGTVKGFDAVVVNTDGNEITRYSKQVSTDPGALYALHNLSLLLTGGLEIKLGGFALTASAVFNPSNLSVGVETGLRGQF